MTGEEQGHTQTFSSQPLEDAFHALDQETREAVIKAAAAQGISVDLFVRQALERAIRASAPLTQSPAINTQSISAHFLRAGEIAGHWLTQWRHQIAVARAEGGLSRLATVADSALSRIHQSLTQPASTHSNMPHDLETKTRMQAAFARIDAVNAADPNQISIDGILMPKELHYGRQMSHWLAKLYPDASEALQLAARAQHIMRFSRPRETYPEGRASYLAWRNDLKNFHAEETAKILSEVGYDGHTIARVRALIRKEGIKRDEEAQRIEDVACVVFLMDELPAFAAKHPRDKVDDILRKTWTKMSPEARVLGPSLDLPAQSRELIAPLFSDTAA